MTTGNRADARAMKCGGTASSLRRGVPWWMCWATAWWLPIAAAGQEWQLETIDGRQLTATSLSVDEKGLVTGEGLPESLYWADLWRLEKASASNASEPTPVTVMLVGQGQLGATSVVFDGAKLLLTGSSVVPELPVEAVRGLIWQAHDRVAQALGQPLTDRDQLIVTAEEAPVVVAGVLESLSATEVQIQYQNRTLTFPLQDVMGIVWADVSRLVPDGSVTATWTFRQGDTLHGRLLHWREGTLGLQLVTGHTVVIQSAEPIRVDVQSDRMAFLSDLAPLDVEQRTWFAPHREWQRDRNVLGSPLTLIEPSTGAKRIYAKGLGVQAYTRLIFELRGDFDRLRARVGIDATTEGRGDCDVSVLGDGLSLWSSRIRSGDPAQSFDVDISGVRRLELVVEPGHQFDLGDHANWADARLIKIR